YIHTTQSLIPGTVELMQQLKYKQYNLYGLTDNVHFIIKHLRQRYDFWQYFTHVTVSAEIGMMKPDEAIFNYVITKNNLLSNETVFIDDHLPNILSAKAVGMHVIQFFDIKSCVENLKELGVQCHE
ncbi:MAG: HAD-IA family hydrolase, partial [Gammaproteobacteria bacterium]